MLKRKPAPAAPAKLPSPPPRSRDRPRDGDRSGRDGRPSERHGGGERSAARPSDRDRDRRGSDRGRGSPARRRRTPSPRRRCTRASGSDARLQCSASSQMGHLHALAMYIAVTLHGSLSEHAFMLRQFLCSSVHYEMLSARCERQVIRRE